MKFLCSWTCSIRIFMDSTLIMDPVHLNKLFSISNWLFLIPCYCQNSIGHLWNTLCSNNVFSCRIEKLVNQMKACGKNVSTQSLVEKIMRYMSQRLNIVVIYWRSKGSCFNHKRRVTRVFDRAALGIGGGVRRPRAHAGRGPNFFLWWVHIEIFVV